MFKWLQLQWTNLNSNYNKKLYIGSARKIVVIGTGGGCGKTTLSKKLLEIYGNLHYIDMDSCVFGKNWNRFTDSEFINNIETKMKDTTEYIIDTKIYDQHCPLLYPTVCKIIREADLVIWLDLPLWLCICRILSRSIKRKLGWESIGVGGEETLCSIWQMIKGAINYRQYKIKSMLLTEQFLKYSAKFIRIK